MSKLYVVNHLSDEVGDGVAAIITSNQEIQSGVDYKVSPVEAGFDYVKSLFKQFDEIVFDKNHDNYPVLLQQSELEFIDKEDATKHITQLDSTKLNFFGCSHTYGVGHKSKATTYPALVSSNLGVNYNNYGLPGKGNYDIEDLLTNYSVKSAKIIIQFTDMYRVRYLDNRRLVQDSVYRINHKHPVLFSEENLFFNFKQIVNRIAARLKDSDSQFLITYTNNIDNEWAVEANSFLHGFNEYCSAVGTQVDIADDGAHYGILSHRLWAERLYAKWMKLYGTT